MVAYQTCVHQADNQGDEVMEHEFSAESKLPRNHLWRVRALMGLTGQQKGNALVPQALRGSHPKIAQLPCIRG